MKTQNYLEQLEDILGIVHNNFLEAVHKHTLFARVFGGKAGEAQEE